MMTVDRAIRRALDLSAIWYAEAEDVRWTDPKRYEACRNKALVLEQYARDIEEMDRLERGRQGVH